MGKTEVITLKVGQLCANCYILIDKETSRAVIIDPGDDAFYIQRIIADKNALPIKIIATHGHFDHILAGLELQLAYKIPFCINKADIFLLNNMQSSAKYFLGYSTDPPPQAEKDLFDGEMIKIGSTTITVIHTPGHTPGSVCFYIKNEKSLFTGDLLFADGSVGRTDFSYSNTAELKKSLHKIFRLDDSVMVLPGHGDSTLLKSLLNPANL